MDRSHYGLVSFARNALLGAIFGALGGFAACTVFSNLAPARFEAAVILYHLPGSGLSDSGRDFIARTLAEEGFQQMLLEHDGWHGTTGKELLENLRVSAADASRPIAELRLVGDQQGTLTKTLKQIAEQLVAFSRTRQQKTLQSYLDELATATTAAKAIRQKLAHAAPTIGLQEAAQELINVATKFARQRRELELLIRYRIQGTSARDEKLRQQRMEAVRKLQRGHAETLAENAASNSAGFEQALRLALADIEVLVLEQTQTRLKREYGLAKPLQILRRDKVAAKSEPQIPIAFGAALGGILGMLIGGIVWSFKRPPPASLSAQVVQQALRVPLVGVMADTLVQFGEREQRPLAESNPAHIAVAALHSLRVALHVLEKSRQAGPAIAFTGLVPPSHLSHLVSNLAVLAAQAGEQVLLIEIGREPCELGTLVAGAANDAQAADISFVHSDDAPRVMERVSQFLSGKSLDDFDRILIQTDTVPQALNALTIFGGGLGVFVCHCDQRLSAIRKAGAKSMQGLVVSGFHLEEPADYSGSDTAG